MICLNLAGSLAWSEVQKMRTKMWAKNKNNPSSVALENNLMIRSLAPARTLYRISPIRRYRRIVVEIELTTIHPPTYTQKSGKTPSRWIPIIVNFEITIQSLNIKQTLRQTCLQHCGWKRHVRSTRFGFWSPAIRRISRSLLRSSSTCEPSDSLFGVVFLFSTFLTDFAMHFQE